ncbi:hypothetical protein PHET_01064, partial [Paragonimus heterotremus]
MQSVVSNRLLKLLVIVLLAHLNSVAAQDVNWDVTYLLNRRYDVARADEDFPIVIQPPVDGTLYHVPAMQLFPEATLPNDTFFIHLMFQPRKETLDRGVYLLAIRDPDNTLRLGLQIVHMTTYQVILQYNPVELDQSEKKVEFSIPWTEDYWHLGVQIEKNQASFFYLHMTKFYTSCSDIQTVPYHTYPTEGILGTRLFRDGATFFALNSGLNSEPKYFTGLLKSFNFQSSENAVNQMCTKADPSDGSGYGNIAIDFDPTFGNVLVTSQPQGETNGEEETNGGEETDDIRTAVDIHEEKPQRYYIINGGRMDSKEIRVYDTKDKKFIKHAEVLETGLIKLPGGEIVAPASKEGNRFMIFTAEEMNQKPVVFDRLTGEQLTDVQIDRHGVLHLPDGSKAVQTST